MMSQNISLKFIYYFYQFFNTKLKNKKKYKLKNKLKLKLNHTRKAEIKSYLVFNEKQNK